jgi:hypothetical protein
VRWMGKRQRHSCAGVALRRAELGLCEEQALGKVGAPEVGAAKIGSRKVSVPEVSADEVGPSKVGACKVGGVQVGADEVGSPAVQLVARNLGTHKFARAEQQSADLSSVTFDIGVQENVSWAVRHGSRRAEREPQFTVDGMGRLHRQRCGQIPQQFVKLPHDREDLAHLLCGSRGLAPIPTAERDLGNLLARAEAVIHGAAWKAVPPEIFVNAASKVWLQIGTGMPGGLVNREIGRDGERRCDTAQPKTAFAVSPESAVPAVQGTF